MPAITTLTVESVPIDSLHPDPANPRHISEEELDSLTRSMRQWGIVQPILARREDAVVIGGHQRLVAARRVGLTEVPVTWLDITQEQARLLNLALDRIGGSWDDQQLGRLLTDLGSVPDLDLSLSGFGDDEVSDLLRKLAAAEKADRAEDFDVEQVLAEAEPRTRPGDLWLLGEHRLPCGDATDPPYGVGYDPSWRNEVADGRGVVQSRRLGKVANDDRADWTDAWLLSPASVAYVWHGGLHAATVSDSLVRAGFEIRSQLIWVKPKMVCGRGSYHWHHEPCWYAVKTGATANWAGDRTQTTVWQIDHLNFRSTATDEDPWTLHGTQKPLEAMARPIRNHHGDVYDPFLGSGTTLLAVRRLVLDPGLPLPATCWMSPVRQVNLLSPKPVVLARIERKKSATFLDASEFLGVGVEWGQSVVVLPFANDADAEVWDRIGELRDAASLDQVAGAPARELSTSGHTEKGLAGDLVIELADGDARLYVAGGLSPEEIVALVGGVSSRRLTPAGARP